MFCRFLSFICILASVNGVFASQNYPTECSSREILIFDDCYNKYLSNFDVNTFWWYSDYINNEQNMIWNNLTDALNVCEKFSQLQHCLGNSVINMCLTENTLKFYYNTEKYIARGYIIDYRDLDFMCNDGKKYFASVYNCAKNNEFGELTKMDNSSNCETAENVANNILEISKYQCDNNGFILACNLIKNQISVNYAECDFSPFCTSSTVTFSFSFSLIFFLFCFF